MVLKSTIFLFTFCYIGNYRYVCIVKEKNIVEIGKCLSNSTRVKIMQWLKEPEKNFPANETSIPNHQGVCVGSIQEKAGLTQSTISTYLSNMERCGLLKMFRHGKWSYYSRNEKVVDAYCMAIK